jgi:membrane fusion protein (multidrug efflux system)
LTGHVESFAPATGAQFALLPPDNATGNFTKVVQRVPVKILIDDLDLASRHIALGMSVTARLGAQGKGP